MQLVLEDPDDELATLGYGMGEDIDVETAICHAVDELSAEGDGDILVFLPGERDIRDTEAALLDHLKGRGRRAGDDKGAHPGDIEILPLSRAANSSRAASRLRTAPAAPRGPGDECRGDVADGAGHPLRHRPGFGAHFPLFK